MGAGSTTSCCCRSTLEGETPTLADAFRSERAGSGCDTGTLDSDCRETASGSSSTAGKGGSSCARAWERRREERGALRSWLRGSAWSCERVGAGEIVRRSNCKRWPGSRWALC